MFPKLWEQIHHCPLRQSTFQKPPRSEHTMWTQPLQCSHFPRRCLALRHSGRADRVGTAQDMISPINPGCNLPVLCTLPHPSRLFQCVRISWSFAVCTDVCLKARGRASPEVSEEEQTHRLWDQQAVDNELVLGKRAARDLGAGVRET